MLILYSHSGLRYLALVAGLAVIVYAIHGLATKRPHDKNLYNLAASYRLLMDVNLFMGVALLFGGRFYPAVGTHIVVMVFATAVAHVVPAVMRKREPEARTLAPYIVATAVSLVLVAVGTVVLGQPVVG